MVRVIMLTAASFLLAGCAGGSHIASDVPRGAEAYKLFPAAASSQASTEYRLGPLDTLGVTVFQEPDLSTKEPISVDASGNITLPLVGALRAAGRTTSELSTEIATRLGQRYLVDPQVSVTVVGSVSQKVTVQGEVTEPGVYELKGPTTLLETLSLAKGETRVASLREVVLFRTINGQRFGGVFDVQAIRSGRAPDPQIAGNDLVVVGLNNAKNIWRDVLTATPVLNILRPIAF
jgi:polysaccharide biosynthesis/export protein